MKYQILGIIVSITLLLVGVFYDITTCIIAGIVFMLCNIGAVIGVKFREQKKLIPILLIVGLLAFIVALFYIRNL